MILFTASRKAGNDLTNFIFLISSCFPCSVACRRGKKDYLTLRKLAEKKGLNRICVASKDSHGIKLVFADWKHDRWLNPIIIVRSWKGKGLGKERDYHSGIEILGKKAKELGLLFGYWTFMGNDVQIKCGDSLIEIGERALALEVEYARRKGFSDAIQELD